MTDGAYLLTVAAVTSVAAYGLGRRWRRLATAAAPRALVRLLEWAGFVLGFYALNLAVGFLAALATRRLAGIFVSVYVNSDTTLLALSAFQAVLYQWWRAESADGPGPRS